MQPFISVSALVEDDNYIAKIGDACAKENRSCKTPRPERDGVAVSFEEEYEFFGRFG